MRLLSDRRKALNPSDRITGIWMVGLLLASCLYCLPRADVNATSHLDLTLAALNYSTLSIDRYHSNTSDVDLFRGHYYTGKAPGLSVLGVPTAAVVEASGLHLKVGSMSSAHSKVVILFLEYLEVLSIVASSAS